MNPATIKLFLPNGEAQSLRTAEISNWSGKAIAGPRSELDALLARDEMRQPGVYILVGTDPESGKPAAYIGQAEEVGERLRQQRDKEFWVHAIIFVSKDENLTRSHILYLEGRLIDEAERIGRFEMVNRQTSGSRLPESDRQDMEVFLSRAAQLLPVLGCDILTPILQSGRSAGKNPILICRIKGLAAKGQRSPNGFVVFKNSAAVKKLRPSAQMRAAWLLALRDRLILEKTLVDDGDKFVFARDIEFTSPSAAAAMVLGGHANGLIEWKTSEGKTLKELEASLR